MSYPAGYSDYSKQPYYSQQQHNQGSLPYQTYSYAPPDYSYSNTQHGGYYPGSYQPASGGQGKGTTNHQYNSSYGQFQSSDGQSQNWGSHWDPYGTYQQQQHYPGYNSYYPPQPGVSYPQQPPPTTAQPPPLMGSTGDPPSLFDGTSEPAPPGTEPTSDSMQTTEEEKPTVETSNNSKEESSEPPIGDNEPVSTSPAIPPPPPEPSQEPPPAVPPPEPPPMDTHPKPTTGAAPDKPSVPTEGSSSQIQPGAPKEPPLVPSSRPQPPLLMGPQTDSTSSRPQPPLLMGPQTDSTSMPPNLTKPSVPQSAGDLPTTMKDYVTKCFTLCQNDTERDSVEKFLKDELNRIVGKGEQWLLDFSTMPLPPILQKKQQHQSRWDTPPVAPFSLPSRPTVEGVHPEFGTSLSFGRPPNKRTFQESTVNQFAPTNKTPKKKKLKGKMKQFQVAVKDQKKLNERSQRFQTGRGTTADFVKKVSLEEMLQNAQNTVFKGGDEDTDWCEYRVQGTSTELLKQYLRLTSAPDPSTVRPELVLKKSLQRIKDLWLEKHDYRSTCEQLKSVRQDLTVQGIRNSFTVEVYESHARVALEMGDHEEFNQCQNQLKELYVDNPSGNEDEFLAYRILYSVFTRNTADLARNMASVSSQSSGHPAVSHALKLKKAWLLGNYHLFFKLYPSAPHMGTFLLDKFVTRERVSAFKTMMKAYRPSLSISFITSELGFSSEEDCMTFLDELKVTYLPCHTALDCKATFNSLSAPQN